MTILDSDLETYQTTVSDFVPQIKPDACYPTAIKNILDDLAEKEGQEDMSMSLSEIGDLCNYREGLYTEEEIIPEALSSELSEYGFQAVEATAPKMDFEELQSVIESPDSSLPIVELDPMYFDQVENYRTQGRREASHTVIVFKVNSDRVLYYDPYEKFFEKSSRIDDAPCEWSKTGFYELWSGDFEERWTFWIEPREQSLLDQFGGE